MALHRNKDMLNRINVFPIPDGDTGSNMCITLRDAVKSLEYDLISCNISNVWERQQEMGSSLGDKIGFNGVR